MIGSLRGVVLERLPKGELLVEVGGVGYRVSVPATTLAAAGAAGSPVFLHVHTHVRDDAIVLYGFASSEERVCFEALIGAHGIGPAVALAILSTHTPAALRRAVLNDDVDALVLVPGIGKKTATRLLMELKSQLDVPLDSGVVAVGPSEAPSARTEVQAALAGLGYAADEIREVLRDAPDSASAEDMLRGALRQMAAAR